MSTSERIAAAYNARVNDVIEQATYSPMFQARVTRELVRMKAADSSVQSLLSAIVRGLMDGAEDPALRPFCEIAMEEVECAMERISQRYLDSMKKGA
jgi:hypothetical protein